MSIKVKTVEYVGSFPDYQKAKLPHYPQIAIAGRSNVGKSSLINKIMGRKSIARVSSTPGKTRMLNFFAINDKYMIIDLPGYGYAKVAKEERSNWRPMVEGLLKGSPHIKGLLLLIDGRRGAEQEELELLEFCDYLNLYFAVVFTKADKLNQSQRAKLRNTYENCLFFSAVSGEGKKELLEYVFNILSKDIVEL